MATLIDIVTEISVRLGLEPVQSLEEETIEAQAFAVEVPLVLDRCLARTAWPFNTKTLELSRLVGTPTNPLYQYQFAIPSDLVRFDQIVDTAGRLILGESWTREGDVILAKRDRLLLRYGRRISNAEFALAPVPFQHYFATSLAYAVAPKLSAATTDVQRAYGEIQVAYQAALVDACRSISPTPLFGPGSWR
ncbi:MAG: hypothetical protein KF889_04840 [Alphaproteobacteria bacterium]|nr:hypothetical protein [Alphaproteobacteria bacterium]MCW5742195.1 hypothetical protein [Alphaproteobacteria bacterium]